MALYDHLSLELARGRASHGVLAGRVFGEVATALAEEGGEVAALFSPLLGFASNEASLLVRWRGEPPAASPALAALAGAEPVVSARRNRLSPTLRPKDGDLPREGGVYVQNWFTVDAGAEDEFVALSGQAWPDFEARFDTRIFGLFRAQAGEEDRAAGASRLLLVTWYADLGVWQASRNPTTDAWTVFMRRHELTRVSLARSCLLVSRP